MSDAKNEYDAVDGDPDVLALRNLVVGVYEGWRFLLFVILIFLSLAILKLNLSEKEYIASIVVGSTSAEGEGSNLGRYASLASIAGVNLSLGRTGDFDKYESLLISTDQIQNLIDDNPDILPTIFGGEWDEKDQVWKRPGGVGSVVRSLIHFLLNGPKWQEPSVERLTNYLRSKIVITKNPKNGFLTILYENRDSDFAARLVLALHRSADDLVRSRAEVRTFQRLSYLSEILERSLTNAQRDALIQLLLEENQKMMMIQVDESFVAEIVQFPLVSKIPSSPQPIVTILLACLAGFIFGCFGIIAFGRDSKLVFSRLIEADQEP